MSLSITLYGIANCDTVKKARRWLDDHKVTYNFHDFRRDGLSKAQLKDWLASVELDILLNRRSRTWRELDDAVKNNVTVSKGITLMMEQPTLIKRPILTIARKIFVGFDATQYESLFNR